MGDIEVVKDISVVPEVHFLEQVLERIAQGELRVPKFQRPFLWRPEQMLQLFDSMERGYPMGSLLIWETAMPLESLDTIGGRRIPLAPEGAKVAYVLDGHQRLSTLFGVLHRSADAPRSARQEDWMWWVYRPLVRSQHDGVRYRHWKSGEPVPSHFLPMRSVLGTLDFLEYARTLSDVSDSREEADRLTKESERIAKRVKNYKVSVVRMEGGTLQQAIEVFSRINSSGQKMRPDQMVSALTYGTIGSETLSDKMEEIKGRIAASGFGEIPIMTIFQTVLALSGEEDVYGDTSWETMARKVQGQLMTAVEDTDLILQQVVEFLRDEVRVPLARLVPYNIQIMLLAVFFHFSDKVEAEQRVKLRLWFWTTSLAGTFAGSTTTQVRKFITEMKAFARGKGGLSYSAERARSFPERFDLRSARVRAYLLWDLQTFPDRKNLDDGTVNVLEQLATAHSETYRHVITQSGVPGASSPANRIVMTTPPGVSIRQALIRLAEDGRTDILDSHGVSLASIEHLKADAFTEFILARQHELAARERQFIESLGIKSADKEVGEADIDTE
ncbi:DUF262 domain-containing protein [Streptomyces monashensis]|uniref:GmrSD restriction endonucleases N-terminal domain-containing protein n=1 Tax=Streptomyces monashensis TaxID=1678012 RepID=A0A1S2QHE4_9ACTN|nr:DUF262 domain-containing protein [Streptomyces monashensis]OIK05083.1 hypothetical protein BIV23_14835 [Streptomyces monashensis]